MEQISTKKAPNAIGPYSQAIRSGDFVFCSGQIAIDPKTNEFKPGTIVEETTRVIENLKAVLEQANSRLEKTIKVAVYLSNIDNFTKMNTVYENYFSNKPARSTIEVSRLPKGAKVEIDAIAEI
ncbi:MAG: reactive intermediate/imine deaminase [Deltaproteobacteria bacterium]|nr:MAG: reactive intermediate/imine deaminase [Deltaproteobacteria bacterium]